jgi:hypothetical protein
MASIVRSGTGPPGLCRGAAAWPAAGGLAAKVGLRRPPARFGEPSAGLLRPEPGARFAGVGPASAAGAARPAGFRFFAVLGAGRPGGCDGSGVDFGFVERPA